MGSITRQAPDSGKFLDFTYNRPGQDIRYSIVILKVLDGVLKRILMKKLLH